MEMTMRDAVRMLFEQAGEKIKELNIDKKLLDLVMPELVRDYVAEKRLDLAYEAAIVTGRPSDMRYIYDATKGVELANDKGDLKSVLDFECKKAVLLEVLLKSGTAEELREAAMASEQMGYLQADTVVKIYTQLKNGDALIRFGKELVNDYFADLADDEQLNRWSSETDAIAFKAMAVLEAIQKRFEKGAEEILEEFGDKLLNINSELKVLDVDSGVAEEVPMAIQAFRLAGTKTSLKKAAEGCQKVGNLKAAVHLFHQVGEIGQVMRLIKKIAEGGELLEAVELRAKLFDSPIHDEELAYIVGATTEAASIKVPERVSVYLRDCDNYDPFPTAHTFWHNSDSNEEWGSYLNTVNSMAGPSDNYYRGTYLSIAKELYLTDKASVISAIHKALQKHLLVGYLLSALAMEVSGACPSCERKYSHAYDAAWRTFCSAYNADRYNPFDHDLKLESDPEMKALMTFMSQFNLKKKSLMIDGGHSYESSLFMRRNCPELRNYIKNYYDEIADDIRKLLIRLA